MKTSTVVLLALAFLSGMTALFLLTNYYLARRGVPPVGGPTPTPSAVASASPVVGQPSPSPYKDLIVLASPVAGEKITSPLVVTGQARGNWFFEATFPVILTDWDGKIIAEGYAEAQGEWMTTEYVPFKAELSFTKPVYGERGSLILKKANVSGLPENDDALEIMITF